MIVPLLYSFGYGALGLTMSYLYCKVMEKELRLIPIVSDGLFTIILTTIITSAFGLGYGIAKWTID